MGAVRMKSEHEIAQLIAQLDPSDPESRYPFADTDVIFPMVQQLLRSRFPGVVMQVTECQPLNMLGNAIHFIAPGATVAQVRDALHTLLSPYGYHDAGIEGGEMLWAADPYFLCLSQEEKSDHVEFCLMDGGLG